MKDQKYVCLGNCQAVISSKQYDAGLKACGNDNCKLKGNPFAKGDRCEVCDKNYSKDNPHIH